MTPQERTGATVGGLPAELVGHLPPGFGWLLDALEACGDVMEAEGLTADRSLPMTVLAPPADMRGMHLDVYRAHVRELCTRWRGSGARAPRARQAELDRLTRAEILAGLVGASQLAPLDRVGLALYSRLFQEVFPESDLGVDLGAERWPGQLDELLGELSGRTARRNWGDGG